MPKIYIRKNNSVIMGPYTVSNLKQKAIRYSDKIWYEGLAEWTPAKVIDFLKGYVASGFFNRFLHVSK